MFTNEQRAHDLAIALINTRVGSLINETREPNLEGKQSDLTIDVYKEYKDLYELSLKDINRDFPINQK